MTIIIQKQDREFHKNISSVLGRSQKKMSEV